MAEICCPAVSDVTDIAICGGGLAGLTLALQVKRRLPGRRVTVFEPTRRPLPEACHKVGESSVEVGAHYFGAVLGLHDYMMARHLPKNGLRFFSGVPGAAIEARAEMGPREAPRVPAYQIDRGRFENDLRAWCLEEGVDLREGWGVRDVTFGEGAHRVTAVPLEGAPTQVEARWVVDATGRRRLIAKKLGLQAPLPAQSSSAWFRVAERVKVAELANEAEGPWHERDVDGNRWLSTNHLCGEGYWVWLIPLGSGYTSVGIVAEESCHAYRGFSTEAAARDWLRAHEPALAARLEGLELSDFIAMKGYRHGATQVFGDRWALVGEAGIFVDPLYSPGSDMIALGNSLTTELIAAELDGQDVEARRAHYDAFFRDWAALLARTLCEGSRAMGRPEVLGAKLYWDYFYYWACMCPYFLRGLFREPLASHARFHEALKAFAALNEQAQRVFQAWIDVAPAEPHTSFVGLPAIATTLSDLHLALLEARGADETHAEMQRSLAQGRELVDELWLRAVRRAGPTRAGALVERIGWRPAPSAERLAADEAEPRQRRKLLSKPVRDMERSIGKNARESGPSLAELVAALS